jgi:hypothetical protein
MDLPELPDLKWDSVLHWCLRVMDYGDPLVARTAELLADFHSSGALTWQQEPEARVIHAVIQGRYNRHELACQQFDPNELINATSTPVRQ